MKTITTTFFLAFLTITMLAGFAPTASAQPVPVDIANQYKAMFVGSMITANTSTSASTNIKQAVSPLNIPFETLTRCSDFVLSLTDPSTTLTAEFLGRNASSFKTSWTGSGYVGFVGKCVEIGD